MTTILPPDVAKILASHVASGSFASTDDALRAAANLLNQDAERRRKIDALRAMVQIGIDQADRGEMIDGEDAFDEVLRELDEKIGK